MPQPFATESELTRLLVEYLIENKFIAAREVPNMGQSVDVAARRSDCLYLFEAKLNDWRKAIKQAETHLYVANYTIVVLPQKRFSCELCIVAKEKGIGVLTVDCSTMRSKLLVRPQRSNRIWEPQRKQFERHLETLLNDN